MAGRGRVLYRRWGVGRVRTGRCGRPGPVGAGVRRDAERGDHPRRRPRLGRRRGHASGVGHSHAAYRSPRRRGHAVHRCALAVGRVLADALRPAHRPLRVADAAHQGRAGRLQRAGARDGPPDPGDAASGGRLPDRRRRQVAPRYGDALPRSGGGAVQRVARRPRHRLRGHDRRQPDSPRLRGVLRDQRVARHGPVRLHPQRSVHRSADSRAAGGAVPALHPARAAGRRLRHRRGARPVGRGGGRLHRPVVAVHGSLLPLPAADRAAQAGTAALALSRPDRTRRVRRLRGAGGRCRRAGARGRGSGRGERRHAGDLHVGQRLLHVPPR